MQITPVLSHHDSTELNTLPHEWPRLLFWELKPSHSLVQSVSGYSEMKENPNRRLCWFPLKCVTASSMCGCTPTSRISLRRVILWKGRTRNDLRLCLWHTGSLSSFLIEQKNSRFCCLLIKKKKKKIVFNEKSGVMEHKRCQRYANRLTAAGLQGPLGTSC